MSSAVEFRVLLVEDNPIDAEMARHAFQEYGSDRFLVVHVPNVDDALRVLDEGHFDFIVTDRGLPGPRMESGVTLLRTAAPLTPIVVHTATAGDAERTEALRRGADAVFQKGDPAALVRSVTEFLLNPKRAAPPEDFRARMEARLKPGLARYYRMLDLGTWYPVVAEPDAHSFLLHVDGELRDVDASHFDTRTELVL